MSAPDEMDPKVAVRAAKAVLTYLADLRPDDDAAAVMRVVVRSVQTAIDHHPWHTEWQSFYDAGFSYEDFLEALENVSIATIDAIFQDLKLAMIVEGA